MVCQLRERNGWLIEMLSVLRVVTRDFSRNLFEDLECSFFSIESTSRIRVLCVEMLGYRCDRIDNMCA
jgi:hypothetical protein